MLILSVNMASQQTIVSVNRQKREVQELFLKKTQQESPTVWTQEAYRPLAMVFCLLTAGGGLPHPVLDGGVALS